MQTETQSIEFTRVNSDVNGNPRYVCHYSAFITDKDREEIRKEAERLRNMGRACWFSVDSEYALAVKRANKLGGRKFHNKQYGGGIVFQSYNIENTEKRILELLASL